MNWNDGSEASSKIWRLEREVDRLKRVISKLEDALGPASDDILKSAELEVMMEIQRERGK